RRLQRGQRLIADRAAGAAALDVHVEAHRVVLIDDGLVLRLQSGRASARVCEVGAGGAAEGDDDVTTRGAGDDDVTTRGAQACEVGHVEVRREGGDTRPRGRARAVQALDEGQRVVAARGAGI